MFGELEQRLSEPLVSQVPINGLIIALERYILFLGILYEERAPKRVSMFHFIVMIQQRGEKVWNSKYHERILSNFIEINMLCFLYLQTAF